MKKNTTERIRIEIHVDENLVKSFYPIVSSGRSAKEGYNHFVFASDVDLKKLNYGRHVVKVVATGFGTLAGLVSGKHLSIDYTACNEVTLMSRIEEKRVPKRTKTCGTQVIDTVPKETGELYEQMKQRIKKDILEKSED